MKTYISRSDAEARAIASGEQTAVVIPCRLHRDNPGDLAVYVKAYPHVHVGVHSYDNDEPPAFGALFISRKGGDVFVEAPYAVGDVIGVKEAWVNDAKHDKHLYRADGDICPEGRRWRITPRLAIRTHLVVLSVSCRQTDGVWCWQIEVERKD